MIKKRKKNNARFYLPWYTSDLGDIDYLNPRNATFP